MTAVPKLHLVPAMAMIEMVLRFDEEFVLPIAEFVAGTYTVVSAAKKLGVDRQRIYQLIEADNLQGIRLLDTDRDLIKIVVSKASVDAYLEYREKKAAAVAPKYA